MSKFRILITVALALAALDIHAHYASSETQRVPIDRILRNLDRRLARNSNSVELLYYAARVHAMAYSTNLKYLDVQTDDNFPRFEHPGADDGLPDRITLRSSDTAQQNANNHLTNAIRYY